MKQGSQCCGMGDLEVLESCQGRGHPRWAHRKNGGSLGDTRPVLQALALPPQADLTCQLLATTVISQDPHSSQDHTRSVDFHGGSTQVSVVTWLVGTELGLKA